jgi:hypothetical protein
MEMEVIMASSGLMFLAGVGSVAIALTLGAAGGVYMTRVDPANKIGPGESRLDRATVAQSKPDENSISVQQPSSSAAPSPVAAMPTSTTASPVNTAQPPAAASIAQASTAPASDKTVRSDEATAKAPIAAAPAPKSEIATHDEAKIERTDETKQAAKKDNRAAQRDKRSRKQTAKNSKVDRTEPMQNQMPDIGRRHTEYVEVDDGPVSYAPGDRGNVVIYRERAEPRGPFGLFGE